METTRQRSRAASASALRAYYPLGTAERHQLDSQLAQMKRAELEQRQAEEAGKDCLFQPKTNVKKGPGGSDAAHTRPTLEPASTGDSVFDRLREQARRRQERQELREQAKQEEEARQRQAEFHPRINRRTPLDTGRTHQDSVPVEDRLLYFGKTVEQKLAMQREERERKEQEATKSIQQRSRSTDPKERQHAQKEFLHRNSRLLLRREINRQIAEQKAAQDFSFHPKISPTSAAIDSSLRQQPSQNRNRRGTATGRSGSAPTHARPVAFEDLFPATGYRNDSVGFTSATATAPAVGTSDRGTLLYERAVQAQQQKLERLEKELLREQMETCNGNRPRTNPLSEDWIQYGQRQQLFQQDFVRRQALYDAARKEELEKLAKEREAEEAEKSRPTTTAGVTPVELKAQVTRLYYEPLRNDQRPGNKKAERAKALMESECPFAPQLSNGTQAVLKRLAAKRETDVVKRLAVVNPPSKSPIDETNPTAHSARPVCRELYETTPEKHKRVPPPKRWDFSPARDTDKPSAHATSPVVPTSPPKVLEPRDLEGFHERQERLLRTREEKAKLLRQRELVEEMAECTFRPKTSFSTRVHGSVSPPDKGLDTSAGAATAPAVSGLQQYLERQRLAKRLKEEKEEKMRNMGRVNADTARLRTSRGTTVVAPFHLQTNQRHADPTLSPSDLRPTPLVSGETSLFVLNTEERERALSHDYAAALTSLQHPRTAEYNDSVDDTEETSTGYHSSGSSSFQVYAEEPQPAEPWHHVPIGTGRTATRASSGGEACYPRVSVEGTEGIRAANRFAPSASLLKGSRGGGQADVAPRTGRKDPGSRSVSFVELPVTTDEAERVPTKPSGTPIHTDPYATIHILSKLRDARKA